ncbi:MAG: hypothetical protein HY000_28035 [Planctomycetes bacterium]|nr:hypothetical protein [Planctomycetota bacterium]
MSALNPCPEWLVEMRPGLRLLWGAHKCAHDERRPPWDYAVELPELRRVGLTSVHLRRLANHGYVVHADAVADARGRRSFRPARATFGPRTCFVLTDAGAALAGEICGEEVQGQPREPSETSVPEARVADDGIRPRWDGEGRELWFGRLLVKRIPRLAPNQGTILDTFEEEEWPHHIDDPLTGGDDCDAKQRLRDTIRKLNQHQIHRRIRFHTDGTGEGVIWEPLPPPD